MLIKISTTTYRCIHPAKHSKTGGKWEALINGQWVRVTNPYSKYVLNSMAEIRTKQTA